MLKETETENTIIFFVMFLSLIAFQFRGARAPWAPSLATPIIVAATIAMGPHEAYAMCRWTLPNGSRSACTAAH